MDSGFDYSPLDKLLAGLNRGRYSLDEFFDAVRSVDVPPAVLLSDGDHDVVSTVAELHRRFAAVQDLPGGPDAQERFATQAAMAVVRNLRVTVVGDLRFPRYRDLDPEFVRAYRAYWENQVTEFIESSPADLQLDRVRIAALDGLDTQLSTDLLLKSMAASVNTDRAAAEIMSTALVRRFVDQGDEERAVELATGFGAGAHRLLLGLAQQLPRASTQWVALSQRIAEQHGAILADGRPETVLYAAANAVRCDQPAFARELLTMADLDSADLDTRMELYAAVAVIHRALGDNAEALACAQTCAHQLTDDQWGIPKAAGWLLADAEPDPAARMRLLKRAYTKYDGRAEVEGRLMFQAAQTYLDLGQPVLAAYFLMTAGKLARSRGIGDHFVPVLRWELLSDLLEEARVTDDELAAAAERLATFGYLPKPSSGEHFWRIEEQWYTDLGSDHPDLVQPEPARVNIG